MIRRNILTDTGARDLYVQGVTAFKQIDIGNNLNLYDFFVIWHHSAMTEATPPGHPRRNAAHVGPAFLPWHRYYLRVLEGFMRQVLGDDDFRLPYWSWGADGELANPLLSQFWSPAVMGGSGSPIGSGPFANWTVDLVGSPGGQLSRVNRGLERALGGSLLPDQAEIRAGVDRFAFYDSIDWEFGSSGFRNDNEVPLHNTVHGFVGGDMIRSTSPNDPVFFLHHANVDRIWEAWMQTHPTAGHLPDDLASAQLFFHRSGDPLFTFLQDQVTNVMMWDQAGWTAAERYQYDTLDDLI